MNPKQLLAVLPAASAALVLALSSPAIAQDKPLLVTLTGQSMIRSDMRATAPA